MYESHLDTKNQRRLKMNAASEIQQLCSYNRLCTYDSHPLWILSALDKAILGIY